MDELKLPELLQGRWKHALFLTYGVDIPLFEGAIRTALDSGCRNRIVLADGRCFLEACTSYAHGDLVRHLNKLYVADGVLVQHAMHAKAVLLVNDTKGRLLVGSGNLGLQGFASGGELFTKYEYGPQNDKSLNAFLALRELLDNWRSHKTIGRAAAQRIDHLFEETPWLFGSPVGVTWPLRHNLKTSLLSQLREIVAGEQVEECYVLSPFFDPGAVALATLLEELQPIQTTLLVQPKRVSLDPTAVARVVGACSSKVVVRAIERGPDKRYVHAKLYLVKTATRAICLQGSPNLSQVAMLRSGVDGNIELANLLEGPRDNFDHILDALSFGTTITSWAEFEVDPGNGEEDAIDTREWYLTRGELDGARLHLHYRGTMPELSEADLVVGRSHNPINDVTYIPDQLELLLDAEVRDLLDVARPVSIRWRAGEQEFISNPIFVADLAALNRVLEIDEQESKLQRLGDLDLEDAEIEQLLAQLGDALVIDRRSVWQLVGRRQTADQEETPDDGPPIMLDDIDYESLRRHPKIQQYLARHGAHIGYSQSRLQMILSSITDQFQGLVHPESVQPILPMPEKTANGDLQPESEEESEQQSAEQVARRRATQERVRRILTSFINRYIRGMKSPDFQQVVGSRVMTLNYVIFSHLLWRLFSRDWMKPEYLLKSLLEIWLLFWGANASRQSGYWSRLTPDERSELAALLAEHHVHGQMLAAAYTGAGVAKSEGTQKSRENLALLFALRDQWRALLTNSGISLAKSDLEDAWYILAEYALLNPPRPSQIAAILSELADYDTREHFVRRIEGRFHFPPHSCRITKTGIIRPALNRHTYVEQLVLVRGTPLADVKAAQTLVQEWMRVEPRLGYYRITAQVGDAMIFYDTLEGSGAYSPDTKSASFEEFGMLSPATLAWHGSLQKLQQLAVELDHEVSMEAPALRVEATGRNR